MAQLHAEVLLAKDAIMAHGDYASVAYVSLIYKDAAGVLHYTDPASSGHGDTLHLSINLTGGSVIVGSIHDHPAVFGRDESTPSAVTIYGGEHGDWYYVQQFVKSSYFDLNLVTYILDD